MELVDRAAEHQRLHQQHAVAAWPDRSPHSHDADRFLHLYGHAADLSAADDPAALCGDDPAR